MSRSVRIRPWAAVALCLAVLPLVPAGAELLDGQPEGPLAVARDSEPVVVTGADLPAWSRAAAQGVAATYPSGVPEEGFSSGFPPGGDGVRSAHNGTITVPPDARTGAPVDQIAAYRWEGKSWVEVPVQVDERFPHFLANARSDFGFYSGTDPELTYAWTEESWKQIAGECAARYPTADEIPALVAAGYITPGQGETAEEYAGAKSDPVPTLDDDDEIAFMASDAGERAPEGKNGPAVSLAGTRHELAVADPTSGAVRYVYLFQQPGGSSFDASNGYVRYERDANADEYLDRRSFDDADPEKLGSSNTGYGPNLPGTVCRTSPENQAALGADGTPRASTDRFPRDGLTVTTDAYRWRATGRWMIREVQVAKPGQAGVYGPDLVDRWKGRAFQQSPDSQISVVGFEDEQVNWEANSTVLGWKAGPVRAMREVWGADSGTNVTKLETFYRDAAAYRYRVRVHPIPPDGLYTSWDYNAGVATRYYNALRPEGVAIDGANDDVGQVDSLPGVGPAFFDAPDPTFDLPSAIERWEQVAGTGDAGSLVYLFELTGPSSAVNFLAVPYYRDDKCLDDGTGDDPVARPWPGEASTDSRVVAGYGAGATCDQKQGAWGAHGLHFFATGDSDNAFSPAPVTELDGQQWQFAVPMDAPRNVGESYAQVVRARSRVVAAPQSNEPQACPPAHSKGRPPHCP